MMSTFRPLLTVCVTAVSAFIAGETTLAQQARILPIVDHVHLAVPDQAKGVQWYQKHFGGEPIAEAPDRLMFGDTRLIFLKTDHAQPSAGSAIDHIGFSVRDLDSTMQELVADGAKVTTSAREVPGLFKLAFVDDPWGIHIEIVQDSEKLGFHHIHLRAPDPAATLAWYKQTFGGESAKLKNRIDGIKYTGVWVLAQRGEANPSEGHAIDHIGWRTDDLSTKTAELKGQNVKFTGEPRPLTLASGTVVNFAYLEGPAGAKIELVQR